MGRPASARCRQVVAELRNLLRRALRRAGLPPLRFHDMRHLRTTLAIYTHTLKRKHDDCADRMAERAGLTSAGNKRETSGSVAHEETELSACFIGSPGRNRSRAEATDFRERFLTRLPSYPRTYPRRGCALA